MKRIKLVLAALAVMVAALAAFSGLAMADDLNCRDAYGNLIRCDGQYYAPVNNGYNDPYYNGYSDPYYNNYGNDFGNVLSNYIDYSLYNDLYGDGYGGYNSYWY